LTFLAKLGKDLQREYDAVHQELLYKANRVEQLSPGHIEKEFTELRDKNMEALKNMIWDLHPKLMNLFRENQVLIDLEETLDTVKEYFVDDTKKSFKDEVDEIDILNKNGHFAYVCSRMDYYKDLEQRMADTTQTISKASNRAQILVKKLTNFKLNKDYLKKMLVDEFKRRNIDCSGKPAVQAKPRVNVLSGAQAQGKNSTSFTSDSFI
jgi:hypothetical protein